MNTLVQKKLKWEKEKCHWVETGILNTSGYTVKREWKCLCDTTVCKINEEDKIYYTKFV